VARTFDIILTDEALSDLDAISDRRTYAAIERKIDELVTDPVRRSESLAGTLSDFRSVRAAGKRYQVIYQVLVLEGVVTVVVIGIRKDVGKCDAYRVASKRLKGNRSK
jgi:mRNA interferase RelE/StbE